MGRRSATATRRRRSAHQASSSPASPAGDSQHAAFGEELTHQPAASGAERGAHGQLALPRRSAREQQVRDVGAGDQQDECDGAEQHEQRRPDVAGQLLAQGTTRAVQPVLKSGNRRVSSP